MKKIAIIITILLALSGIYFYTKSNKNIRQTNKEVTNNLTQKSGIKYTLDDIKQHNTPKDCFMVIESKVYDVTKFIASGQHNPQIEMGCGLDATNMFNKERKHQSGKSKSLLDQFLIGYIN
jgi:cytochrome b involved in lipid metabolism